MYTAADVDALRERLEREGKSKAEIVKALAYACMGWPYVFGAWGAMCTPEERKKRASYNPEYQTKIYNACPVLNGSAASCAGCKWNGCRCFDCRGFTAWLLKQAGLDLYGEGATTQYSHTGNWAAQGKIADMPRGLVCCVFKQRDGKMSHTGMYVGGGEIVHCSTVVKTGTLNDTPAWTHYGIPAGMYSNQELKEAGIAVDEGSNIPTLRRGAVGELVKSLQEYLNETLCAGLAVDGKFGAKTEEAVKAFQKAHGLTADGIVGPKTWAAMGGVPEEDEFPEDVPDTPEEQQPHLPDDSGLVLVPRATLESIAETLEDLALDIRGYAEPM